jgi:N-acetylneuraminate synthase
MTVTICAEIGLNHNGSVATAIDIMRAAAAAGCDVVKLQKRDLDMSIRPDMRAMKRSTPWGEIAYADYKARVEMSADDLRLIAEAAHDLGIAWSASAFDPPSVEVLASLGVPWIKLPSAAVTDVDTLRAARQTGLPVILSTGGSTWLEIDDAVAILGRERLTLLHCTSTYPHTAAESKLLLLTEMQRRYGLPVGYSGHEEPGSNAVTLGAVALGAVFVERHVTLSRHMWGSDQSASLEPGELADMVREIRELSAALTCGGERHVSASERKKIETMRRSTWTK